MDFTDESSDESDREYEYDPSHTDIVPTESDRKLAPYFGALSYDNQLTAKEHDFRMRLIDLRTELAQRLKACADTASTESRKIVEDTDHTASYMTGDTNVTGSADDTSDDSGTDSTESRVISGSTDHTDSTVSICDDSSTDVTASHKTIVGTDVTGSRVMTGSTDHTDSTVSICDISGTDDTESRDVTSSTNVTGSHDVTSDTGLTETNVIDDDYSSTYHTETTHTVSVTVPTGTGESLTYDSSIITSRKPNSSDRKISNVSSGKTELEEDDLQMGTLLKDDSKSARKSSHTPRENDQKTNQKSSTSLLEKSKNSENNSQSSVLATLSKTNEKSGSYVPENSSKNDQKILRSDRDTSSKNRDNFQSSLLENRSDNDRKSQSLLLEKRDIFDDFSSKVDSCSRSSLETENSYNPYPHAKSRVIGVTITSSDGDGVALDMNDDSSCTDVSDNLRPQKALIDSQTKSEPLIDVHDRQSQTRTEIERFCSTYSTRNADGYRGIIRAERMEYYRNKTKFTFGYDDGKIVKLGFIGGEFPGNYITTPFSVTTMVEHSKIAEAVSTIVSTSDLKPFMAPPRRKKTRLEIRRENKYYRESGKPRPTYIHQGVWKYLTIRSGLTTDIGVDSGTDVLVILTCFTRHVDDTNRRSYQDTIDRISRTLTDLNVTAFGLIEYDVSLEPQDNDPVQIIFDHSHHKYVPGSVRVHLGQAEYLVSPQSFFQINYEGARKMYDLIFDTIDSDSTMTRITKRTCLDLYCGTGTIGLYLEAKGRVSHRTDEYFDRIIGIDCVESSIDDAKHNASVMGIKNSTYIAGKCEHKIDALRDALTSDIRTDLHIVIDPARDGMNRRMIKFISYLIREYKIKSMIYCSCNVHTWKNDLIRLQERLIKDRDDRVYGVRIKSSSTIDMFPHTTHYEVFSQIEFHDLKAI